MSIKQDRAGTRTAEDLRRRINVTAIEETVEKTNESLVTVEQVSKQVDSMSNSLRSTRENYVSTEEQNFTEAQKSIARINIGAGDSSFSGSYYDLKDKPTTLADINAIESMRLDSMENYAQENVLEKIYVAGEEQTITNKAVNLYVDSYMSDYSTNPVQNKVVKAYIDENSGASSSSYSLSSYKVSGLTILRSACEVKNDRVCINFVGTLSMNANTTTTLFNLPSGLCPSATRDFVVFGQSSNNDGYIGYGYVTSDGLLQVRFNNAISSYIRFSCVYDL